MFRVFALALIYFVLATPCFALKEVRSIPTRDGVTLNILERSKDDNIDKTALILFPGGEVANSFKLEEDGRVRGNNFLVRTSKDFAQEMTAVVVDAPSDHKSGMDNDFRQSAEHALDITKLIDYLTSQGAEKIFLVGTSRGTLSVASLATKIQHPKLKGIVLTSSLEHTKFMRWLPLEKIKLPVLMVHHTDDACKICSLYEAKRTRDALAKFTQVDFIEVTGGVQPKSGPCEALSAHGFLGVEDKAVQPIIDWIKKH